MIPRFVFLVVCVSLPVLTVKAEDIKVVSISGACQRVELFSKPAQCALGSPAIYMALPNGIVMFQFSLDDQSAVAFAGDRDSQPEPEEYTLYVKRVRISRSVQGGPATDVDGTCKMTVSTGGSMVHQIICSAADQRGGRFLLEFRSDGQPVKIETIPSR
jgi:hypothetical protein